MKTRRIIFSVLMCIGAVVPYTGCSDNDQAEVSVAEQQAEKLMGSWKVTAVTLDNVSQDDYEAFTMNITPNTASGVNYTIVNNPDRSPWISVFGGRLFFDERDPAVYLIREDDVSVEYAVTDTALTMEFTYQEESKGGRTSGISGNWKFIFTKQ